MLGVVALLVAGWATGAGAGQRPSAREQLAAIERRAKGRLGVGILDPVSGRRIGWREHERFAHCSSFKLSLAALVLAKGDAGDLNLSEMLQWKEEEMLPVSPATSASLRSGLSIRDLAKATLVLSDNTAANVLLRRLGGPAQLTRFWRSLGDGVSRLDRYEPALNVTPPGTELDTTTPAAMASTVSRLVRGSALAPRSRDVLKGWMTETKTGRDRLRAGFPASWVSGDKTGTGIGDTKDTYVDLAFGGPPGRAPLIVAAYFEPAIRAEPMDPNATGALAQVGAFASGLMTAARPRARAS